jgi:hypothetical protein
MVPSPSSDSAIVSGTERTIWTMRRMRQYCGLEPVFIGSKLSSGVSR